MIIAARGAAAAGAVTALDYRWVMVGSFGDLRTSDSTTASSWTTRTSSFGSTQINSVATNRTSLYVAVGNDGKLATSPDGITWTQRTSSFSTSNVIGVAFGNGVWVAVGADGKIATSTDGTTWTQRTSGTANSLNSIGYGNGLWVTCGESSTMRTATDPTSTWTSRTSTLTQSYKNAVYYWPQQAIWVAGTDAGTTGALASSPDGITWTARNSAFSMDVLATSFTSTASVLVCANTTNIFTPTCDVQTSTNGTTWTDRTPADTTESMSSAAVDDAGFMIVVGTKVQSTTDGTTWTDRGASGMTPQCVCHSAGLPAIR